MTLIFKLAWRNLWRYKRRTILAIISIAIGSSVTILMYGMLDGSHTTAINGILRSIRAGHIIITKDTLVQNLDNSFAPSDSLIHRLLQLKGVTGGAPHLMTEGLVSLGNKTLPVYIIGFDPEFEESFAPLKKFIRSGNSIEKPEKAILLGEDLAMAIGADLDSMLVIISQDVYKSITADLFAVKGLFKTGNTQLDQATVFININTLRDFLFIGNRVSDIAIMVENPDKAHRWLPAVKKIVGDSLIVRTWKEAFPSLRQTMELDSGGAWVIIFILIIVVGVEVFATLIMAVTERFREFGVLNAIGMKGILVSMMVVTESLYLWILGTGFGNILGYLMNLYFYKFPIEIGGFGMKELFGSAFIITSTLRPTHHIFTSVAMLVIILVSSIYPVLWAIRVSPVEAMKDVR